MSAPGILPVLAMDKARALLAAGLAGEAAASLTVRWPRSGGSGSTTISRRLSWPARRPHSAAGEPDVARRWAAAAERHFRRLGNDALAVLAVLTGLRAAGFTRAGPPGGIAAQAAGVAGRLRGCGLAQRRGHGRIARGPGPARGRAPGRG